MTVLVTGEARPTQVPAASEKTRGRGEKVRHHRFGRDVSTQLFQGEMNVCAERERGGGGGGGGGREREFFICCTG